MEGADLFTGQLQLRRGLAPEIGNSDEAQSDARRVSGVRLGRAMLEQLDMNTMDMEPSEPLLPVAAAGSKTKPPLPPLRLPSLPADPPPARGGAHALAPLARPPPPATSQDDAEGEEKGEHRPAALSATAIAVDAVTAAGRLAGLSEFLSGDQLAGQQPTTPILPGAGGFSPQRKQAGRGTAAELVARAEAQSAALRRHGDRVRALQLARRALGAVNALRPLRRAMGDAESVSEAVGTLEAAAAADRARWFGLRNSAVVHERLSGGTAMELGLPDLQQASATAQMQCAALLQDAAAVLRARLASQLRQQADAQTQILLDVANRFNAVLLSMPPPDGMRHVLPIDAPAELAQAAIAGLGTARIVAAAMLPAGAVGLGSQLSGGHAGPAGAATAAALRCDAEAVFSDHLYAISAELAPPRPPIGPSGIPPSGAAPLPSSFKPPVAWHLSKVGSGVVGILQGLCARCETLEAVAPHAELGDAAVAQVGEVAGVAVCLFHSWAAQVFQRERCSLLELCTLHSDSLAVSAALESLRQIAKSSSSSSGDAAGASASGAEGGSEATEQDGALAAAIARLSALQHAISNHLSDGLEESASSFWELLPDKYWCPSSKKAADGSKRSQARGEQAESSAPGPHGGSGGGAGGAGEYMQRLVGDLIAPGTKTLLKLDPATARELLPRIVGGSLESLAAHLLKARPRFNEAGARRLRLDVRYLEAWVQRKLGDEEGDGDGGQGAEPADQEQDEAAAAATSGQLAATLLALPTFQRLRSAAALLADPEDRVAKGQLSAADAQAGLALHKWRPRIDCGAC